MSEKLIQCEECGTEHPVDECRFAAPPPDKQPAAETLRQVAERIVRETILVVPGKIGDRYIDAIENALRNERERAVRIINEHRALDVCKDNCWTTIKAAIREGK